MDDTIYKCGNRYYVFAREVGYHPSLSQFALIMVPISYAESSLNRIEVPQRYAVIEISSNYADYLSGPELNNAYDLNAEGVAFYGAINLSEAEKLPLRNRPSPPLITQMDGSFDIMENTVFIRKEKALSSWWLLPVVPAALAVDVPVSAAATVLFDGVALPGIVLFKGTMTLAGIYDQPDNTIETHVSTPATMPSR
ncbi:hypothetical protein SDC9_177473 [bioreactor metagenome]|uniref:Uncharacterized protein n=1 Tax=bioreactor metagenome TaxID=1076179 RepID=A0A645GUT7_9ZZZZ